MGFKGVSGFLLVLWMDFTVGRLFRGCWLAGHFGIKLEEFFESFSVVFEAATDVDALEDFVVAFVGLAQVGGHVFGGTEIGDRLPSDF
jgi:hypothetical protein